MTGDILILPTILDKTFNAIARKTSGRAQRDMFFFEVSEFYRVDMRHFLLDRPL